MCGGRIFALCFLLLTLSLIFAFDGQDESDVRAEPGQNLVTLPCIADENKHVVAVRWGRTDLGEDDVLLHRDGQLDEEQQHPSFKNRVGLQDGAVKAGDVSLVLREVTADDGGTYGCWVAQRGTDGGNSNMKLISTIHLDVAPPLPPSGNQDGSRKIETGHRHLGLIAAVVIFVLIIGASSLVLLVCRNNNG